MVDVILVIVGVAPIVEGAKMRVFWTELHSWKKHLAAVSGCAFRGCLTNIRGHGRR
jgi:hypothetical protein